MWTNEVVFGSTFCTVIVLMLFRHRGKQKNSYSILNFAGCPIIKWLFTAHQKWHTLKNWIRVALSFIPRHHQQQHNVTCAVGERCGVYWTNKTKITRTRFVFNLWASHIFIASYPSETCWLAGRELWLHSSCILTWHFFNYKATHFQCTIHIPTI